MKTTVTALLTRMSFVAVLATIGNASTAAETAPPSSEVDSALTEYVRFLERQKVKPVDYLLGLFQTHDLVVLCERAHPETTQYDMIYDLVSDPRFVRQVGHVFTEVGTISLRPFVESFLMADALSDEQVNAKLRHIAMNFHFGGFWEKTDIYDFLRRLYALNRALPRDLRVHLYPSDLEFCWETMTAERHSAVERQLGRRDRIMADNVINKFNEVRRSATRNKALVIMNYRHAFPHLRIEKGGRARTIENTGGFLMAAYPGRVANVMINSFRTLPGTTDRRALISALQDGKWDAAFEVLGNPSLGFPFEGSPFGDDGFDYFPFPIPPTHRYQEIFTGFVFQVPLKEHRLSFGLPGLVDEGCSDELLRRDRLLGRKTSREQVVERIRRLQTLRTCTYDDKTLFPHGDCAERIQRWLEPAHRRVSTDDNP